MRKILMTAIAALISFSALAQKGELVLNNQTITNTVVGKWNVVSVQPSDKVSNITYIVVKGPGFGEIGKRKDGNEVAVVSKIFAANNSQLVLNDADGTRSQFTIKSLTTTQMILSDGTVTLTLYKN
jgi:hypothetical protein